MIDKKNFTKIYNGILEGEELTTKLLNSYGFNSRDLNNLILEGKLIRIKRGLYSLKSVDKLFYYGKELITKKEYEKADMCFEKCFLIDSTHTGVCFQLFLRSIKKEDYQRTFELFDNLYQTENEHYKIDLTFYLYLLSIVTEVPEKYKEYARNLKIEDIKVPITDKRYKDKPLQNKIRIAAIQRKFSIATKQLKDATVKQGYWSLQDVITNILLNKAYDVEKTSKLAIVNLIKETKYNEVVAHLLDKQKKHNLSMFEEYVLKLANSFIEMYKTSTIPEKGLVKSKILFDAIDANDYETALKISTEYNEKNNISNDSNAINLILFDICALIMSLNKTNQVKETDSKNEEPRALTENIVEEKSSISIIMSYLKANDIDNAIYYMKNYMKLIEKTNYEFLIIDLIKICLLEKNSLFNIVENVLLQISNDNFSFEIASYIKDFYIVLSQEKLEEARIYLDIISNSNKLGQECVITEGLYSILKSSEEILEIKRNNFNSTDKAQRTKPSYLIVESSTKTQLTPEQPLTIRKAEKYERINNDREFWDKQYEKLILDKGIILLKAIDNRKINQLLEISREYPNMAISIIGSEEAPQILLRYIPSERKYVNIKNLISLGDKAYLRGDFNSCIAYYSELLQYLKEPYANIYSKLGLAYMKKHNIKLAIDYLTVATIFSKEKNLNLDFSDLILKLKGEINIEDVKPTFKMKEQEFNYIKSFYGIENFYEINDYISKSGLDVETACKQIGLSPEKTNLIKIIYAREFYTQGNFKKGDLFLTAVERSKSKTKETIQLLNELRANKKFYQNRTEAEETIPLTLSLVPKR